MLPDPVLTARLIRIGADATTPPHLFVNADGKVDGLEFDFMKALGQELGMSVGVVSTSFSGLAPSLLSGRIDAAMSDFSDTIEQVDFVAYSRTADVSSSAGEIRTTSDLCGLKVSATQ
jgi:polar amino acid transport system substrate-binding protein